MNPYHDLNPRYSWVCSKCGRSYNPIVLTCWHCEREAERPGSSRTDIVRVYENAKLNPQNLEALARFANAQDGE